jgi:hypothetical protein
MAKYKLISCNVFQRELCAAIADSPNIIDPEFLELGLHERPEGLRAEVQARVDEASADYDAILLGYGLCGNGLSGLRARAQPLVLARAHDCCTILLGSRAAFLERFGDNFSAPWSSAGYIERGTREHGSMYFRAMGFGLEYDQLIEKYGEENGRYIWDTMHPAGEEPVLRFIETAETAGLGYAQAMRAKAAEEGKEFLLLPGSSRLLRALLSGSWDDGEFLVVPPGWRIAPLYDQDRVFVAEAE